MCYIRIITICGEYLVKVFRFILHRKSDSFKEAGIGNNIHHLDSRMLKHMLNKCGVLFICLWVLSEPPMQ